MSTYDPADGIRYVHLAADAATPAPPAGETGEDCRPLPADYANDSLRWRLGARPALRLLPGGAAA